MLPLHPLLNTRRSADKGKTNTVNFNLLFSRTFPSPQVFISILADVPFRTPSPTSPTSYPCLYPGCGHISSRAHDLKRHMTVHFPAVVDELLDCKYEWCGRTGAHGFKREDHRRDHYRKVHFQESDNGKRGKRTSNARTSRLRTTPPTSTTSLSPLATNASTPAQSDKIAGKQTARKKSMPASNNPRNLKSSTVAEDSDLQSVRLSDRTATASDKVEIGSSEATGLSVGMDKGITHEHFKDDILNDLGAHVDWQMPTGRSNIEGDWYYASLNIDWDVSTFLEDQFCDPEFPNTTLGPIVTISGSAQRAQATTCSDYIQQNWPAHGSKVLDALQDALQSPSRKSKSKFRVKSSYAELEFNVTREKVLLNIKTKSSEVIEGIVQQLAWMGAALRTSTDGRVQYCEPKLTQVRAEGVEPVILSLTFHMSSLGEDDQSCWFPLFKNLVIAHRFPVADRSDCDVGLEIPLDMMAALGGARHAVEFEGGLVLKGYSTLFVPVGRRKDSVQWHLICAKGEDRIAYSEASAHYPNRALLEDIDHDELRTTRAFLGWCKEAQVHLATADADYESIDWSKAKKANPSPKLTGGSLGISKLISANVNFALGAKDGAFHYSQSEPFQKTVDRAERLPVLLYDQKDRRAWLVPALLVILHIIQLRNHIKPFSVGGTKVQILPLDPSRQGSAAREAVDQNKSKKLYDCESSSEKDYCFRDAMLDIWSILDRLMEREATSSATPGMSLNATWQTTLYGWELRDVADDARLMKQKKQILQKTAGRWVDLVNDVDAVVLFASGLGDIIKPKPGSAGLCQKWRHLPKEKDYLAVCVSMLKLFYAKSGHRQDREYLTSAKLQWHQESMLFEQCADVTSDHCDCDRLQQVFRSSSSTFGLKLPPKKLEANGCVVFGQAKHPLKSTSKPSTKSSSLYTLSNDHINSQAITNSNSSVEKCIVTSSLTSHSESYHNKNHRKRTPSSEGIPLHQRGSNYFPLNESFSKKTRRHRLPHFDRMEDLDVAIPSDSQTELSSDQEKGVLARDINDYAIDARHLRSSNRAPDNTSSILPNANSYKAPSEHCQHRNGCSCKIRFTANLSSTYDTVSKNERKGL